jgi:hypothetical protein
MSVAELVAGAVLIGVGALLIRFRADLVAMNRQTIRDQARYGSLLNPERANRIRDAELSEDAERGGRWGVVAFGGWLIVLGVVVLVGAFVG